MTDRDRQRTWAEDVATTSREDWGGWLVGRAAVGLLGLLLAAAVFGTVTLAGPDWVFLPIAVFAIAWGAALLHPAVASREEAAHRRAVAFRLLQPQVLWVRGSQPKVLVQIQGGLSAVVGVVVLVGGVLNLAGVVELL